MANVLDVIFGRNITKPVQKPQQQQQGKPFLSDVLKLLTNTDEVFKAEPVRKFDPEEALKRQEEERTRERGGGKFGEILRTPPSNFISSTPTPKDLARFGTDQHFKYVGQNKQGQRAFRDPFGNVFFENKSDKSLYQVRTPGEIEKINQLGEFAQEKTRKPTEEFLQSLGDNEKVAENDQFILYKAVREFEPQSEEDLLQIENMKRLNYNLEPLEEAPEWIKKQAQSRQRAKTPILVVENKNTGAKRIITTNPYNYQGLQTNSAQISKQIATKTPYTNIGGPWNSNLEFVSELNQFMRSAPKEILDFYGVREEPKAFDYSDILGGITRNIFFFEDQENPRTYMVDQSIFDTFYDEDEIEVEPANVSVKDISQAEPGKPESGLIGQVKALPQFLKIIATGNNPYMVDLGGKKNFPPIKKQKEIAQKINKQVEPSLLTISFNPKVEKKLQYPAIAYDEDGLYIKENEAVDARVASSGTGFAIDDNKVITNRHVIETLKKRTEEGTEPVLRDRQGKIYYIEDMIVSHDADVGVIITKEKLDMPKVELADNVGEKYEPVVAMGYARGIWPQKALEGVYLGTLSDVYGPVPFSKKIDQAQKLGAYTNKIVGGYSGGPVLNQEGKLIGINATIAPRETPRGFRRQTAFVPVDDIRKFLKTIE